MPEPAGNRAERPRTGHPRPVFGSETARFVKWSQQLGGFRASTNSFKEQTFEVASLPPVNISYEEYLYKIHESIRPDKDRLVILNFMGEFQAQLSEEFEPAIPCCFLVQIDNWRASKREINHRAGQVVRAIGKAKGPILRSLSILANEISKMNSTPLLLPVRNFQDEEVSRLLKEILGKFAFPSFENQLRDSLKKFMPMREKVNCGRNAFISSEGVAFRTPGRARHGCHAPTLEAGHNPQCVIAATYRLGVKIDVGFHYDCSYVKGGVFSGHRGGCHEQSIQTSGCEYLNIYPNDYIRTTRQRK